MQWNLRMWPKHEIFAVFPLINLATSFVFKKLKLCKIAIIYFINWIGGAETIQGVKSLREENLHGNMISVSLSPDKFLPKGTLILWVCTWVTNVITNMEESRRLNLNLRGAFFSVILSQAWNSKLLNILNLILF